MPLFEGRAYHAVLHVAPLFDYFADMETIEAVDVEGRAIPPSWPPRRGSATSSTSARWGPRRRRLRRAHDRARTLQPHNRYCESERQQEETLQALAAETGLPLTIVRAAPIYGPGNQYGVHHIPLVLSKMGVGPVFIVLGCRPGEDGDLWLYRIEDRIKDFESPWDSRLGRSAPLDPRDR